MPPLNPYFDGPLDEAAHFDGVRFRNPDAPPTDRSFLDILRWRLGSRAAVWPQHVPVHPVVPAARVDGMRATMIGHATVLIQAGGLNILTDPVWSERVSPFRTIGPRRVTAPGIAFEDLPPIDVILLSHNHYDHLDLDSLRLLVDAHDPLIVTPLGNDALLRRHIAAVRVVAGDWGSSFDLPGGTTVDIVPANHWSARGVRDRRMALWGGFMLRGPAGLVYFAGDTGYGSGALFADLAERYGPPDLALIPIGAYAPRWFMAAQHIDPDEAVAIFATLGARHALGIHWGTFQLTDEPREEPAERLAAALAARGIAPARFLAARPGDHLDVPGAEKHRPE